MDETELNQQEQADAEAIKMRKNALYFVMALCMFSESASLIALFFAQNLLGALIFQLPALIFFYRILCYLFPVRETEMSSLFDLLRSIWRR